MKTRTKWYIMVQFHRKSVRKVNWQRLEHCTLRSNAVSSKHSSLYINTESWHIFNQENKNNLSTQKAGMPLIKIYQNKLLRNHLRKSDGNWIHVSASHAKTFSHQSPSVENRWEQIDNTSIKINCCDKTKCKRRSNLTKTVKMVKLGTC